MKYLKSYNEEWNPIEWAKNKKKEISKDRKEKAIFNTLYNIRSVRIPSVRSIKLSDESGSFYKAFTADVETSNLWNTKTNAVVRYIIYYHGSNDDNGIDSIGISLLRVKFNVVDKVEEAKGPGRRRIPNYDDNFHDSQMGEIKISPGILEVTPGRSLGNYSVGNQRFEYDEKTIISNLSNFISENIKTLEEIYKNIQAAIVRRKEKIDKDKENAEKFKSRSESFLLNEETIKECFLDLIDMCDDYKIESNKGYNPSITINLNIKGIDVDKQSKSSHTKHETLYFDSAHINVTDELFTIMKAIQNSRSHLESVDDSISMKTIFSKNKLSIVLTLKREEDKVETHQEF